MPKLTRNFVQGKMNKDLDERLVPPGQYRDALNIQIATTDGDSVPIRGSVGSVQNITGNSKQIKKTSSADWALNFGANNTTTTRGVFTDAPNNKIYYFVGSTGLNCILEYDTETKFTAPVLVDVRTSGAVFNPQNGYDITGINILDGILFWTDNYHEPFRLNIEEWKTATAASNSGTVLNTTTQIYSRDFKESDITVIRKSPKKKPTVAVRSTNATTTTYHRGAGLNPLAVEVNFNQGGTGLFPKVADIALTFGESQRITPLTDFENKKVLLTATKVDDKGVIKEYKVEGTLKTGSFVASGEVVSNYTGATLTNYTAPKDVPNETLIWFLALKEDDFIYKKDLPRFSYRWKYKNNEYSTFAPFSDPAFIPGNYQYYAELGENKGMINHARKITLTFPTDSTFGPPDDVAYIEVLYKSADSTNIQVIKTHDVSDGAFSTMDITSELNGLTIEGSQFLRPWDNVPRKALAQEIIGNRLVYGNYLQNYDVSNVSMTLAVENTAFSYPNYIDAVSRLTNIGETSLKTGRTYQVGVSFIDEYNRESPVFTDDSASVKLNFDQASGTNQIKVNVTSTAPSWASFYKYYIKEVSGQYYNLGLDRIYESADGNVWLSFPSSERNKVKEGDVLKLKKQHGNDTAVTDDTEYRILDIRNNAPDFISKITKAAVTVAVANTTTNQFSDTFRTQTFFGPKISENALFLEKLKGGNKIQFTDGDKASSIYEIESGGLVGNEEDTTTIGTIDYLKYRVKLVKKGLDDNDAFLTTSTSNQFEAIVYESVNVAAAQFLGKFFVKIPDSDSIQSDVVIPGYSDKNTKTTNSVSIADDILTNPVVTYFDGGVGGPSYSAVAPQLSFEDTNANPADDGNHPVDGTQTFSLILGPSDDRRSSEKDVFNKLIAGATFRFKKDNNKGKIYTITSVSAKTDYTRVHGGVTYTYKISVFTVDRLFEDGFTGGDVDRIEIVKIDPDTTFATSNPAVFETVPKKDIDTDIYYEMTNARNISSLGTEATLNYFNCYSFGNGVESDTISDDFNEVRIGKGVRVSTTILEPYSEDRQSSGLIYSGLFNSISNINETNQFTAGLKITKNLNPVYGSIQKLHARNSDLIALCEDKVIKILANKDALFNADGNSNITSNNNVLGQAIPFAGEFGISKNPESFASYGFRAYFTDKSRATILRLSADGLTDISSKGMSSFFEEKFQGQSGNIIGSYDESMSSYNVTFAGDETISFKEAVDGWTTRLSGVPDFAASLNNVYYGIDGINLYRYDSSTKNTFFDTSIANSTITMLFNDAPDKVKNFKTLSYQGDSGWTAEVFGKHNDGAVDAWEDREDLYFNFIKGVSENWNSSTQTGNLDFKEFNVQGIGQISVAPTESNSIWTITFAEPVTNMLKAKGDGTQTGDFGDTIFVVNSGNVNEIGEVITVNNNVITVDGTGISYSPSLNDFVLFAKKRTVETSGVVGFTGEVKFTLPTAIASGSKELFAVNSEVFISSE